MAEAVIHLVVIRRGPYSLLDEEVHEFETWDAARTWAFDSAERLDLLWQERARTVWHSESYGDVLMDFFCGVCPGSPSVGATTIPARWKRNGQCPTP